MRWKFPTRRWATVRTVGGAALVVLLVGGVGSAAGPSAVTADAEPAAGQSVSPVAKVSAPAAVAPVSKWTAVETVSAPAAESVLGEASTFTAVGPVRLLPRTLLGRGESVIVTVPSVPAGARAATVNVTTASATTETAVTTCTGERACSASSWTAVSPGASTPAALVAPLTGGSQDQITLTNRRGDVAVYVDLSGFVRDASAGEGTFVPVPPQRVLSWQALGAHGVHELTLPDVPAGATAVALDIGYAAATSQGYVSACPAGSDVQECARTSILNPVPDVNRSNFVVVPLGGPDGDRVMLYNHRGSVRLNADLQGYFVAAATASGAGVLRDGTSSVAVDTTLVPGDVRTITLADVPDGATAVQLHLAASRATGGTAVAACPGTLVSDTCSRTSVLSPYSGRDTANTAYVSLGGPEGDQLSLVSSTASVDLTVRVTGYVVPTAAPALDPEPGSEPEADLEPGAEAAPGPTATPAEAATPTRTPPPASGTTPPPPPSSPSSAKPGPGNTGAPDGVQLTRHDGDLVITEPGTVVDGVDVHGFLTIKAADVTIRNSVVRGGTNRSYNTGLISCYGSECRGAVIEDTTLVAEHPSVWLSGILGHDFTARRVDVHHVVDGFGIHNIHNGGGSVNVVIEDSWCHDLSYFASDPNHGGGPTHNDCIQIQGGSNIRIEGNSLESFMSTSVGDQSYDARNRGSGIMVTPNVAPVTGASVTGNWIDGGYASVSLSRGRYGSMAFGILAENRFGRHQVDFGGGSKYVIRVQEGVTFDRSLSTNVWDDGTGNLAVGRDLGIRYDP